MSVPRRSITWSSLTISGRLAPASRTLAVASAYTSASARAGLPAEGNGDPDQAITVTPIDWRRRLIA
ncbi:DUF6891 domain-containing protein [Nonomuraea basaltis]|uniref:DUF6891 domain-containing protein n=1 Tax=Nonomuraea basaltis TaxID=2495887 RepID=UPI00110C506F|nr:hypothetical protein [Nonomuraea basaltis]TMR95327.1 hypothetical protein EJK15_29120 [Nonomuraea basaltis]